MLVAIVGAVLIVTDVVRWPGSNDPRAAAHHGAAGSTTTTTGRVATTKRRSVTADDPLRLWIAGDSLAGSIGPSLGQLTADTGVVQPQYDSRVSSGLLNPNFVNWPKRATEQLSQLDPEVVVFVIGTNDANVWSANLADEYRIRTEAMMRQLAADGREVIWVGAPVAKSASLEKGVLAVNLIAKTAAGRIHGVTYFDSHATFADENGDYQQSFPDHAGKRQVMRAGDGVHFSVAGADLIGQDLFSLLDHGGTSWPRPCPVNRRRCARRRVRPRCPGPTGPVRRRSAAIRRPRTSTASSSTSTSTTIAAPPPPPPSSSTTTASSTPTTTTAPSGP